ncbi:MAG: FAD/NAD(P)-binding oxidoreductase [Chloroflexi bacterium]|nr:FAD/NAD(P)-binding oxidoreductase [Chloroflexota bacterium]
MKTLLILGGGTGGTMIANKMARRLAESEWRIIIVDKDQNHYYQPGFLFLPFGVYQPEDVIKPKKRFIPQRVETIFSEIESIEPQANRVRLRRDLRVVHYDILVIATGCEIRPDQIEGMSDGWRANIFDFYTYDGAIALNHFLETWEGGRLVVNVAEMPIKCPVAPLEFLFLADWYFRKRGMRHQVEMIYATPLSGAFTKPQASKKLGELLDAKGVHVEKDFNISAVDPTKQAIRSWDERSIPYDLLVSIPTNMGMKVIERSGMGDELNYVPTDKHTLKSKDWENVWVIGDAGNVPASKAGSVTHFMLDVLVDNIECQIKGMPLEAKFDGHANCFIETGFNRGVLIDFNYDVEPLPGKYPLPGVGPFSLLKESSLNHLGKMSFKWLYWNILLPGRPMPVSNQLSILGKQN